MDEGNDQGKGNLRVGVGAKEWARVGIRARNEQLPVLPKLGKSLRKEKKKIGKDETRRVAALVDALDDSPIPRHPSVRDKHNAVTYPHSRRTSFEYNCRVLSPEAPSACRGVDRGVT